MSSSGCSRGIFKFKSNSLRLTQEEALVLSRYLIEPNDTAKINYDPTLTSSVVQIKSTFKNLIGGSNFKVNTKEENQSLKRELV